MDTNINRRKALKSVSAAALSSVAPVGSVVAGPNDQASEMIGVTYDAYTHQVQSAGTANISRSEDGITGELKIGGFDIPLGQGEPLEQEATSSPYPTYGFQLSKGKFMADERPLDVQFCDHGDNVVGHITRPGPHHADLAFTLATHDKVSVDYVRKGLQNQGRGIESRPTKKIPSTGIPEKHIPEE